MRYLVSIFLMLFILEGAGLCITAEKIIEKIDNNNVFKSSKFDCTMVIKKRRRKLVKKFKGYGIKEGDKFFMEYYNKEDRGVKYLKMNNELWIYFPDADDVMKISGHMLRDGMMGSDISYEDMMNHDDLKSKYKADIVGEEIVFKKRCYKIDIVATVSDVTYFKRTLYVNKENFTVLKVELFAKSGRLLKKMSYEGFISVGKRFVPKKITIKDMRRKNSLTVVKYDELKVDIPVNKNMFNKRRLYK